MKDTNYNPWCMICVGISLIHWFREVPIEIILYGIQWVHFDPPHFGTVVLPPTWNYLDRPYGDGIHCVEGPTGWIRRKSHEAHTQYRSQICVCVPYNSDLISPSQTYPPWNRSLIYKVYLDIFVLVTILLCISSTFYHSSVSSTIYWLGQHG